ncbi:MAG: glycosyltransferase [Chitinophagaceae bacterium]|nr:glycosyltransferase [Chitinophagaceae bacterium]
MKKLYFKYETFMLSRYQKKISHKPTFVFVSTVDMEAFSKDYGQTKQIFIPCFLPWQDVTSAPGKGTYCLYHGNLFISENIKAAEWLIQNVFSKLNFQLLIAGQNAEVLADKVAQYPAIKLIESPSDKELSNLIRNAHINVLPSMNNTGVKLKLLHALFEGRFCITNGAGIAGTGITKSVHIANNAEELIPLIKDLFDKEFTIEDLQQRQEIKSIYNNEANAQKLTALL